MLVSTAAATMARMSRTQSVNTAEATLTAHSVCPCSWSETVQLLSYRGAAAARCCITHRAWSFPTLKGVRARMPAQPRRQRASWKVLAVST